MTYNHNQEFTVYFAGELFSWKHLFGNAVLADAITNCSEGRYCCVLPQSLEQRGTTPQAIRNQDLRAVLKCDLGLFNFDGPELDSGTVVEFLFAKALDIPAVILRTDFRRGGDSGGDPWNLMASFYPRTEVLVTDSISDYQSVLREKQQGARGGAESESSALAVEASFLGIERLAVQVVAALDKVRILEPVLTAELRAAVYQWARIFPGAGFSVDLDESEVSRIINQKLEHQLL